MKLNTQIKNSVMVAGILVALLGLWVSACSRNGRVSASATNLSQRANNSPAKIDAALAERLKALCKTANGEIGVAVIHVQSGRMVEVEGGKQLPLYSVYKLPLAITVLKRVEDKQISLDQKLRVTPADVAPGSQFNTDLWRKPADKTVAELLEFSIVRSDNTSSDKLLALVGGPAVVTERMNGYGLTNIQIK